MQKRQSADANVLISRYRLLAHYRCISTLHNDVHDLIAAAPGIFIWGLGGCSSVGLYIVGSRSEALVGVWDEAEAVCRQCLQILTAEVIKI